MNLMFNVLIVDDVVDNIQIAMNMLREENYNLTFALSGEEVYTLVEENQFDIILLDIMMPNIDGFTVCEHLRNMPKYANVPIIFLTAKTDIDSISRAFEIGGSDYVTKPFHASELLARVKSHLELYRSRLVLQENNLSLQIKMKHERKRLLSELEEGQKELIYSLTELMETCSAETGEHIKRVATMAHILAKYSPLLTNDDAETIFLAAPMHDIGKATIPHHILHKTAALTEDEFTIMKTHTTAAHKFLKNSKRKMIQAADIIAMQHHERWDGFGYPKGLKGDAIHPYGRVMAVIDVFDALTHKRCYKEAWRIEDAIAYMKEQRGTQFDPDLIDIFMEHIDEFIAIATS